MNDAEWMQMDLEEFSIERHVFGRPYVALRKSLRLFRTEGGLTSF